MAANRTFVGTMFITGMIMTLMYLVTLIHVMKGSRYPQVIKYLGLLIAANVSLLIFAAMYY